MNDNHLRGALSAINETSSKLRTQQPARELKLKVYMVVAECLQVQAVYVPVIDPSVINPDPACTCTSNKNKYDDYNAMCVLILTFVSIYKCS